MKSQIKLILFSFLTMLHTTASIFSQSNELLDDFTAFENDGKVYLNWTVTSGSTCDGIEIFHSNDLINFTKIGDIPGICGSSSEPVSYTFIHTTPLQNSVNNYRLQLGLLGFSNTISLNLIDTKETGYSVFPNPLQETSSLYFKNPRKELFIIRIFDHSGRMVTQQSVTSDNMPLESSAYKPGTYFFTFESENKIRLTGKFLVLSQ